MKFTKTVPEESGFYWAIHKENSDPIVVKFCVFRSSDGSVLEKVLEAGREGWKYPRRYVFGDKVIEPENIEEK